MNAPRIAQNFRGPSNSVPVSRFGRNRTPVRLIVQVINTARELWPTKTAAELSTRTGVSMRQAEKWLALKANISGEAYRRLIQSKEGLAFLRASADGAPWWKNYERQQRITNLRVKQTRLLAEIESIRDEFAAD